MAAPITCIDEFNEAISKYEFAFFFCWKDQDEHWEELSEGYRVLVHVHGDYTGFYTVDMNDAEELSESLGVTEVPSFHVYRNGKKSETVLNPTSVHRLMDIIEATCDE